MPIVLENMEAIDRLNMKLQGDGLYNVCSKYYKRCLVDTVSYMQRLSYPRHFDFDGDYKTMVHRYDKIDYLSNSIDGAVYFDHFLRWALTGAKQRERVFSRKDTSNGINKTKRQRVDGRKGKEGKFVTQSYHQFDRIKTWTQKTTRYAPRESNYFGYGDRISNYFKDRMMNYIKGEL